MTSTISSNKKKNSFLSLLVNTLDKNSSVAMVYVCVLVFVLPILLWANQSVGKGVSSNLEAFVNIFSAAVPAISILFSVIIGLNVFSSYHNKRSTDLYASLPASKTCMFLSQYVGGALIVAVPLILTTVIASFIGGELSYFGYFMEKLFIVLLPVLASYTMIAFLSMCCGTRVDTIVSYTMLNVLYPLLVVTITILSTEMEPGFADTFDYSFNMLSILGSALSPALSALVLGIYIPEGVFDILYSNSNSQSGNSFYDTIYALKDFFEVNSFVIYWCIFLVVVLVASVFLAKSRKNENVQNGFIYSLPKHVITVLAAACGGFYLGFVCVVDNMSIKPEDEFGTFALWAVLGTIVIYAIVSLMYNRSIIKMIKSLPLLAISCVLAVGVYFSFAVDMFGQASYVPQVDQIESVQITTPLGDLGAYQYTFRSSKEITLVDDNNKFYQKDSALTDKENIENVVAMHKNIVDNLHNYVGNMYTIGCGKRNSEYIRNNYSYTKYYCNSNGELKFNEVEIAYFLKNGDIVRKKYYNPVYDNSVICDYMSKIINSTEYKEKAFFLTELLQNPNSSLVMISNPSYYDNDYDGYVDEYNGEAIDEEVVSMAYRKINNSEAFVGLVSALKKDFMADNLFETIKQCYADETSSYSNITIMINAKNVDNYYYYDNSDGRNRKDDVSCFNCTIPIPADRYTNTWNYINSNSALSMKNTSQLGILTKDTIYGEYNPLNKN